MNLGSKIASKRKAIGLTQEQLAEQLHVTRQTLSKWESNLSKPDIDSLKILATIFGCSVESLLDEEEQPQATDKPTQTPVKYPHVFGILSIVLGALGLIPGLIFAIIGKKNSTNPHDKKLNSVGLGISIGGLIVWTVVGSVGGYFLGQELAKQLTSSNFSYTSNTLPEDTYHVYFENFDGALISSTTVKKGEKVSSVPKNPSRPSDISGSYTFKEWQPSLDTIINGDTTFTATYDRTPAQYKARFENWDRSLLEEKTYAYGTYPFIPDRFRPLRPSLQGPIPFRAGIQVWPMGSLKIRLIGPNISTRSIPSGSASFNMTARSFRLSKCLMTMWLPVTMNLPVSRPQRWSIPSKVGTKIRPRQGSTRTPTSRRPIVKARVPIVLSSSIMMAPFCKIARWCINQRPLIAELRQRGQATI